MTDLDELDLYANPGHDRDAAEAMLSQARLKHASRIDDIQVRHLLAIGYRSGRTAQGSVERFDRTDRRLGQWESVCAGLVAGILLTLLLLWLVR